MPDGNTAALLAHEREQARREAFVDEAEAERPKLVQEYISDDSGKNELDLLDYLGDLVFGDPEFLHAFQRCDMERMRQLFRDKIDHAMGDELVQTYAEQLETGGRK